MDITIPFTLSSGAIVGALVFVGKKVSSIAQTKVKKWDKHLTDDDTLHAIINQKLEETSNRLKSVDEKVDRLIDHMLEEK
jgi:hypothetical protein